MTTFRKSMLVAMISFCGVLAVAVAAPITTKGDPRGNFYHFFTKALHVDDSGVVAVPSRFKWSVETGYPGADVQGNNLPDSRVMLRLYDPDQNFTAFTAQMDLATAARLHQELGEIIVKKLENPGFEHHPQLYDPKLIPRGRFKGSVGNDGVLRIEVDKNGVPIIELWVGLFPFAK